MRHTLTKSRLSRNLGVIAAATLAFSLAACSAPSSTEKTPAATDDGALETTELLIGIVPVIDHASVFVAIDEGFFDEEGLSVTAQPAQGGAAAVPAMIAGEMQGAFATYPSFMLAQNSGIGINIVAEGVRGTAETAGVYVAKDSPVQDISDLAGKKIAVNTLNNTGDLTIKTLLSEAGVDLGSVEFIELGFADMMPTLANGGGRRRLVGGAIPDGSSRGGRPEDLRDLRRHDRRNSRFRDRHDRGVCDGKPKHNGCVCSGH